MDLHAAPWNRQFFRASTLKISIRSGIQHTHNRPIHNPMLYHVIHTAKTKTTNRSQHANTAALESLVYKHNASFPEPSITLGPSDTISKPTGAIPGGVDVTRQIMYTHRLPGGACIKCCWLVYLFFESSGSESESFLKMKKKID